MTTLQHLIDNLQEGLDVEVKNWLGGLVDPRDQAKLAKELIALANHGGGYVCIGFDDHDGSFSELEPADSEASAFTPDNIANLIARYLSPPCQCRLEYYKQKGGTIVHPVIVVPGDHRVPVWAKCGSPDQKTLRTNHIYIRRPGGKSEVARTQDDWEKILERLVKARQTDMLNAIREVMNPSHELVVSAPKLVDWEKEAYQEWQQHVDNLDANDARCHSRGRWTVSFIISDFAAQLADLNSTLNHDMPKFSGWPPFTCLHVDSRKPIAKGDKISAWLGATTETSQCTSDSFRSDFWQITKDGKGFLLRPFQEDRDNFIHNVAPRPVGPFFDWTLHIHRMTEVLKFIESLGSHYAQPSSRFELRLTYYDTGNRKLIARDWCYDLPDGAECYENILSSTIDGKISEIGLTLEELVFRLLVPVYEQFDFAKLPKSLVDTEVRRALSY